MELCDKSAPGCVSKTSREYGGFRSGGGEEPPSIVGSFWLIRSSDSLFWTRQRLPDECEMEQKSK